MLLTFEFCFEAARSNSVGRKNAVKKLIQNVDQRVKHCKK